MRCATGIYSDLQWFTIVVVSEFFECAPSSAEAPRDSFGGRRGTQAVPTRLAHCVPSSHCAVVTAFEVVRTARGRLQASKSQLPSGGVAGLDMRPSLVLSAQEYLIHNQNRIADRPTVQGRRERFELTLAFLARDGFVAHRGLPGHDGHEDSSLPEVLSPYGIS